jgi:hypothetical protein
MTVDTQGLKLLLPELNGAASDAGPRVVPKEER